MASTSRSLWLLARPGMAHYVGALTAVGYGWGLWDRALTERAFGQALTVFVAWMVLHAGTLWLNAALDRDEGEVMYGEAAEVPEGIVGWGYLALAVAIALAAWANPVSGLACLCCALLAVAYSHPRLCWKGHPVLGPMVNFVGYGLLSPLAGWATLEVAPNPRTAVVWVLGGIGVLGCYYAAQAFQQGEDAARGYRTLVVTHGPAVTIDAARLCIAVGFGGLVLMAAVGWLPRITLLTIPLWWRVEQWLVLWRGQPGGGTARWALVFGKRLQAAGWVMLLLTFGEYLRASVAEEPVAGLGTASGHPVDRPLLPPTQMRQWEAQEAWRQGRGG